MKIRLFPLYICLLALSWIPFSCNDDAPEQQDKVPVKFSATIENSAWSGDAGRASIGSDGVSVIGFEDGDKIVVDSWMLHNSVENVSGKPNFMYQQPLSYNEGTSSWNCTVTKYWPENYNLGFLAHYLPGPNNGSGNVTVSEDYNKYGYHTIVFNTRDLGQSGHWGNDFLVTPIRIYSHNDLDSEGRIPLQFQHIMAKLSLKIKFVGDPGEILYIKNVNLQGYPLYGEFLGFQKEGNGTFTPIWQNVSVYMIDDKGDKSSSKRVHTTTDDTVHEVKAATHDDDFEDFPEFTHLTYPWTVGYEKPGIVDSFISFELKEENDNYVELKIYLNDIEFKAGHNNVIYATINEGNITIKVEAEPITASAGWWNGSTTVTTTVGF